MPTRSDHIGGGWGLGWGRGAVRPHYSPVPTPLSATMVLSDRNDQYSDHLVLWLHCGCTQ